MTKTGDFSPISMRVITKWVLDEFREKQSIFGVPDELFFVPSEEDNFKLTKYGIQLETPIGVAAGPHTQMAQNIVVAWLCGARFIELKTVQTLDELDVTKPCIDAEDEGYNCEWSQELKLEESFHEYLMAWIMIHLLRDKFGWSDEVGTIFNISVGYNMEGILKPNVQMFLARMKDASEVKARYIADIADFYPRIKEINIPDRLSDNITLSTMHGCPPDEIEKIGQYLIEEGYHTNIKVNPTLLGSKLRDILDKKLGWNIVVPDEAFEHDPKFSAVTRIIDNLSRVAEEKGVEFGVKTTNTLESKNIRKVLPENEPMNYASGRIIHPISINVAKMLSEYFKGNLKISFCAGVNAFNIADVISCNLIPITVCTDILKPGGYTRLNQYLYAIREKVLSSNANNLEDFVIKTALSDPECYPTIKDNLFGILSETDKITLHSEFSSRIESISKKPIETILRESIITLNLSVDDLFVKIWNELLNKCGLFNLAKYANKVIEDDNYKKVAYEGVGLKDETILETFDCISAPCTATCPTDQAIPDYMYWVAQEDYNKALENILRDNPIPNTLGRVCDHLCVTRCVRSHYEKPLAIREIKRFVTERGRITEIKRNIAPKGIKVAIIGSGPSGLSAAYFLAINGFEVTVFEAKAKPGGMISEAIPSFRLPKEVYLKDVERIKNLGVEFRFNQSIGKNLTIKELQNQGYKHIYIAVGAQKGKKIGLENEGLQGVIDGLDFLADVRLEKCVNLGKNVAIIGGGNSAVDAARTAWRVADNSTVFIIYRRTIDQMPADKEEINALLEEGIEIKDLLSPIRIISDGERLVELECQRMKLGELDKSGRPRPIPIEGSVVKIPLDNLIVAIGQDIVLDFMEGVTIELNSNGTIKVDNQTFQTSLSNIYAGGDAVRGPSSVVKAVGDGKKVANAIIRKENIESFENSFCEIKTSRTDMLKRKSQKITRNIVFQRELVGCRDFSEVEEPISEAVARSEAERCLLCNDMCSLCETVCPNKANITYQVTPFEVPLNNLEVQNGSLILTEGRPFRVSQPFQILNIADFCNECGNCATFCPTAGAPYKDKPKFFLKEADFAISMADGYIWDYNEKEYILKARISGKIHLLRMNKNSSESVYYNNTIKASLDDKTFKIKKFTVINPTSLVEGEVYSFRQCAVMITLAKGISKSLPFFPKLDKSNVV